MWQVRPEPFEVGECTTSSLCPFSYWGDYPYTIQNESDTLDIAEINPDALVLVQQGPFRRSGLYRLDGKAIRTIWEYRKELPMRLWEQSMETLPHTGVRVSSLALDGVRLRNPYGVTCMFYLCWTEGDVRWGITPINYYRGRKFMRLRLRKELDLYRSL